MSNVINTNVKSLMARDSMTINQRALTTTMQRLSTGKRINSAADDAAGLGIATRMDSQIKGLNMAIKNANDTVSVVQTAEGAMQEVDSILQRMRELAVQSASDTNGSIDRTYLQAEVSQLSTEIDRIAGTTQFNSMNILDGSYKNKLFQIGANQGQTIGLSIASMKSSVLGVASSNTTAVEPNGSIAPVSVDGVSSKGIAATPTVVKLKFETNDSYTFTLADDVSGLKAVGINSTDLGLDGQAGTGHGAFELDLTSKASKDKFADTINTNLKAAAVDTSVSSNASYQVWTGSNHLMNDATKYDDYKFSISIDGGTPQKTIDLMPRLRNATTPITGNAPTGTEVATAMQSELQAIYGTSITIGYAGASGFTVTDTNGRSIDITQGAGSGAIFGTDAANAVTPRSITGTTQSNLSVAWDGNDLVVTNKAGGKTSLAAFGTVGTSKVTFDAIPDASSLQKSDPVTLVAAATTEAVATFGAPVEQSKLSVVFSDRVGNAPAATTGTAKYSFDITNGHGDKYATITDLDVFGGFGVTAGKTDADIISAVKLALGTGTTNLALSDSSLTAAEFKVEFSGDTLSITDTNGRALAIENFKSTIGHITVVPNNELSKTDVLSTRSADISEARFSVDMAQLDSTNNGTVKFLGTSAGKFDVYVDGVAPTTSTGLLDLSAGFIAGYADGIALAAAFQTAIQTAAVGNDITMGGILGTKTDLSKVTASWDSSTNQVVIRDTQGRNIKITPTALNAQPDAIFTSMPETKGVSGLTVKTDSVIVQGDRYAATQVDIGFNQDNTKLDFAINGIYVNTGTATHTGDATWNTSSKTDMDALKVKLDAVMTKLNSVHPRDVFEYSIVGNKLSVFQRDGGPVQISGFASASANGLSATLTPAQGQGSAKVLNLLPQRIVADAQGTKATTTSAVIQLNGLNDLISIGVSDGVNNYSLAATAVDTNSLTSTQNFATQMNKALGKSTIQASMDTNGKIYFTDKTGGQITLTSFTSGRGLEAVWKPESGQGSSVNLGSSFVGEAVASGSSDATPQVQPAVGGGTSSVKQISILSQAGANKALAVIDSALSYVNSERAKLGAVENRLSHTVDNLTNIVTNTAASKSRIMDTDYAAETTELARAQIIQQAATAMLAQANQQPQSVLALLK